MWVAKLRLKHNSIFEDNCSKLQVTVHSVALNRDVKNKTVEISSLHRLFGAPNCINTFIQQLKKHPRIKHIEAKNNTVFIVEKATGPASAFHPEIIFIKPAITDVTGYEHWEIGSWKREIINKFIQEIKNKVEHFYLSSLTNQKLDQIYFPKIYSELTTKQQQALSLAIEKGYYEIPKKTTLRELARLQNISLATYQQHLQVAEKKTLVNTPSSN
jgi:hypothetical protein